MRITPLDIRNHSFSRRLGGFAGDEVDDFLGMIADDYEELIRESAARQERLIRLETQVEELSSKEAILQETLITAQKLSDGLRNAAIKEAEVLLGEAEIKAEKVLDAAHRRAATLAADLEEMKSLRIRLAASVRATIETHLGLLDALEQVSPDEPSLGRAAAYLARDGGETPEPSSGRLSNRDPADGLTRASSSE